MAGERARRDTNNVEALLAESNVGDGSLVPVYADPTTHGLIVSATISTVGIATSTKQSDGSQKTQIVDASGNVIASTSNALNVAVISGGGGGTQYVTGASQATPTGTVALGYDGSNVRALLTTSTGAQVLGAGSAVIGHVIADSGSTTAITGAVTVTQGTGAALAAGWPTINGELADVSGTFTNATQTTSVTANSLAGYGNFLISINGTYGTATAVFEGSDDSGTTWYGISEADRTDSNVIESGYTSLSNTTRAWQINNPGFDSVRVRSTAVASGTVNVRISPSTAPTSAGMSVSIGTALPAGAAVIGALTANQSINNAQINGVTPLMGNGVTGTGSQRVTIASDNTAFAVNATLSAETTKVIGTINISAAQTIATVTAVTAITNALPAGTNLLGKVGVDQTTPGTTNAISLAQIGATTVVNGGVAGTLAVGGVTANAATKTGNPLRIGTVGHTANPSAVTDGQAVDAMADKLGKIVVVGSIRDLKANQITTITASTAETTIVTSVASTFLDMYGLIITNTSATAVNVAVKDATAGTTRLNIAVPAGDTRGFMLPEGGAIKQAAVTNNWTATVSASVTSVIITCLTVQNL